MTANAGPIARNWELSAAALTLAATLSPVANGASRVFWGWASDRIGRETAMIIAFLAPGGVPVSGPHSRGDLRRAGSHSRSCSVYFTWGEIYSLFPSTVGGLLRHASRDVELRRPLHGEGRGVDHRRWFGAMLFERTGSWAPTFYGSAVMALIAAGLAVNLRASVSTAPAPVGVPATAK